MKVHIQFVSLISFVCLALLYGCIKDDHYDCKQGLIISFYSKTVCRPDTIYPAEINDMTLCVFDEGNRLVTSLNKNSIALGKEYREEIELPGGGKYTVVAWTGLSNEYLDVNELKQGVTQKEDLLFRLKRAQALAHSLANRWVYQGENPSVYVEEKDTESTFEKISVNLLEVTNRVHLSVKGLDQEQNDYDVYIESDNGSMNLDGTIAGDVLLRHDPLLTNEIDRLKADFTLLKLDPEHEYTLVINNETVGKDLYRGNLLKSLLLKTPDVNLNCDHDFNIEIVTQEGGTYGMVEIWVNGWLVHSYDAEV